MVAMRPRVNEAGPATLRTINMFGFLPSMAYAGIEERGLGQVVLEHKTSSLEYKQPLLEEKCHKSPFPRATL